MLLKCNFCETFLLLLLSMSSSGKNSLIRYLVETTPVYGTGSIILIQDSRLCVPNFILIFFLGESNPGPLY